jgi:hypothetical protein
LRVGCLCVSNTLGIPAQRVVGGLLENNYDSYIVGYEVGDLCGGEILGVPWPGDIPADK